jgi:hypothetical protein
MVCTLQRYLPLRKTFAGKVVTACRGHAIWNGSAVGLRPA